MCEVIKTKFIHETKKGTYKFPVEYKIDGSRIEFLKLPFALKDEIKSMQGSHWCGNDISHPRKIWTIANTHRNLFQIDYLSGGNPYEWFDRPIITHDYPKFGSADFGYFDLMAHQKLMSDIALTYHYQIWAAGLGVGKTLSAIAVMKLSGVKPWWWIGPKSSLYGIRKEFIKWGLDENICPVMLSYDGLKKKMREWKSGDPAPQGVIFDETQNIKTPTTQRAQCAQQLANTIRDEYGKNGYVILMTGTPSPKAPRDWWSQCEVTWPGFVKEGSIEAFEKRLGFFRLEDNLSGQIYPVRVAWKNDEKRCAECGHYLEFGHHILNDGEIICEDVNFDIHTYKQSTNEVALLYQRLKGLVTVVHKEDCLDLPDKVYKEIICEPKPAILRVAGALVRTAQNVIIGLTQLRELSDGFQYREIEDGFEDCNACTDGTELQYFHPNDPDATIRDIDLLSSDFVSELQQRTISCTVCNGSRKIVKYKRITREVACPKIDAIVDLLNQVSDDGRIVIFAGFTGSIDRLIKTAQKEGWDTMRVDGRGWRIEKLIRAQNEDGSLKTEVIKLPNPLDYWTDPNNNKVAFIAHPKSGGVSLTLCPQGKIPGSTVAVFYSNDFDPASRTQAEDRIHRTGMTGGATIVDLFHLPTDRRVLNVLKDNRKVELMTLGNFSEDYNV